MRIPGTQKESGFTLIEVIVAMALGLVILIGVYNLLTYTSKSYRVQDRVVEMHQNARTAMDIMTRELKMAGYDPLGIANARVISAQENQIRFTLDITSTYSGDHPDGDTQDPNEDITYALYTPSDGIQKLGRAPHGGTFQPIAEHIQSLEFAYRNENGALLGTPVANPSDIRSIDITLTARTSDPDPNYPHNGGYRTYVLTAQVIPRNLSIGAPNIIATTTTTTTVPPTTTAPPTTTVASTTTAPPTTTTPPTITVAPTTTTAPPPTTTVSPTTTTTTIPSATTTTTTVTPTTTIPATTTTTTIPEYNPPSITNVIQTPPGSFVPKNMSIQVCATVTDDSGLASVILHTNKGDLSPVSVGGDTYCFSIPSYNNWTISYYVIAEDIYENTFFSATYSYTQNK